MSLPDGDAIRTTFLDFWPDQVRTWAIPHRVVGLSADEAEAIRQAHRFGANPKKFTELASRIFTDETAPVFIRMGYGSWAITQLEQFGTLNVSDPERMAEVLALHDKRLAEITRRWVRGFTPSLFVRPFLPLALCTEIRVLIRERIPVKAWLRHAPAKGQLLPSLPSEMLQSLPAVGDFTVDIVPQGLSILIVDLNPVVGSARLSRQA